MSVFDQATCGTGTLCHLVKNWTGNDSLAQASTWLIAKPLAIIGLVIVAVVVRWFLHRVIDRVTDRAAAGLPTVILHTRSHGDDSRLGPSAGAGRRVQRAKTMGSLLKSITSIVII